MEIGNQESRTLSRNLNPFRDKEVCQKNLSSAAYLSTCNLMEYYQTANQFRASGRQNAATWCFDV